MAANKPGLPIVLIIAATGAAAGAGAATSAVAAGGGAVPAIVLGAAAPVGAGGVCRLAVTSISVNAIWSRLPVAANASLRAEKFAKVLCVMQRQSMPLHLPSGAL